MKADTGLKYIFYITLFLVFIIIRVNYILNFGGLFEVEYKTIAIASASFPFGIIKNALLKDCFMPVYHLFIHFFLVLFKNETLIRILNSAISFATIVIVIQTAKKLLNRKLAIFIGLFLSLNHFFLYYTNLIAPYCLNFLLSAVIINYIVDFLRRPSKKTLKKLSLANFILILADSLGIVFVVCEIIALYIVLNKKSFYKKAVISLILSGFGAFLIAFIFLIFHYYSKVNLLIADSYNQIGLNLNSIYLILNEFTSPYLSFNSEISQSKSTLGMLYSFFLNPNIKNINSLKILITLFYSSFLPIVLLIIYSIKAYFKNYKFKILISIAFINFSLFILFVLFELAEMHPIYLISFYLIELFALFYGIYTIKDNFIRRIILFCLISIQIINPGINSFNIIIDKNYPSLGCFEAFKRDYILTKDDFIIMPYMSNYAKLKYKDLNFFNFDYLMLKESKRNIIVKNIVNKKIKSITRNNYNLAVHGYLTEAMTGSYFANYFIENAVEKTESSKSIILVIDKLNSKPISFDTVVKIANYEKYNPHPNVINFKKANLKKNQSAMLYDALKSKAFYDILNLLNENYYLTKIIEYGKNDGDFYKITSDSVNIINSINSFDSDYVFMIFKKI